MYRMETLYFLNQSTKAEIPLPSNIFETAYHFAVQMSQDTPEIEYIFRKRTCNACEDISEDWRLRAGNVISHMKFNRSPRNEFKPVELKPPQHPV